MNVYMTIFRNQLTEADILEEDEDDSNTYGQATGGRQGARAEWYVCEKCKPQFFQ